MEQSPAGYHLRVPEGDVRSGEELTEGSKLGQISRRMVQVHKECYGRGPTKAHTVLSDDVLVCILQGGYLQTERTLRAAGRTDIVSDQRHAMQEVLEERFIAAVEETLGRRVLSFLSANDGEREYTAEVFILEPSEADPDLGSEREAIENWAAQTRRQSGTSECSGRARPVRKA
jgi:uncharacterized protein YbcI